MERRRFFRSIAGAGALAGAGIPSVAAAEAATGAGGRAVSLTGRKVLIHAEGVAQPVRIAMLADTHLHFRDERERPFEQFSDRMAGAYNTTTHAVTGQPTTPEECLAEALAAAKKDKVDLLELTGDLLSFPSEANVDRAMRHLNDSGLPWQYTAGNHDWHYEGMDGSSGELRDTWSQRRLLPLYQGDNPLVSHRDIHGLRTIAVDNSTYEILPEQLDAFRRLVGDGLPTLLFVHIPLYAPGRPLGFGCGHPDWNAKHDKGYAIERRPQWRETGHTQTTFDFRREAFGAPNVLAVFAGHTHSPSLDLVNGVPQIVTDDNASGGKLDIEIVPAVA